MFQNPTHVSIEHVTEAGQSTDEVKTIPFDYAPEYLRYHKSPGSEAVAGAGNFDNWSTAQGANTKIDPFDNICRRDDHTEGADSGMTKRNGID